MRFPLLPISPDTAAYLVFWAVFVFSLVGSLITGALLWMTAAERRGFGSIDPRWEALSRKLSRLLFVSAAVLTGVAGSLAWFSVATIYPAAAADFFQIFFPVFAAGWLGLILGMVFLGVHASRWDEWRNTPGRHWAMGVVAALGFWIAAAVLISLRSFLLTGGDWRENHALWAAVLSPSAIPDLLHWGFLSLALSGAAGMLYAAWQRDVLWRRGLAGELGAWTAKAAAAAAGLGLVWAGVVFWATPAGAAFGLWAGAVFFLEAGLAVLVRMWMLKRLGGFGFRAAALSLVLAVLALAASEASRQAVPSAFLIPGHMYRNGVRVSEVSLLNEAGYWKPVPWKRKEEAPEGKLLGAYLFRGQCAVCHAGGWWEAARPRFRYEDDISKFFSEMERRHPALPVVAGTEKEKAALTVYLRDVLGAAGVRPIPQPQPPAPPAPPKPAPEPRKVAPPEAEAPPPVKEPAPPPEGPSPEKKAPAPAEEEPPASGTPPPVSGPEEGTAPQPVPPEKPEVPGETPARPPAEQTPPPAAPAKEKKPDSGEGTPSEKPQTKKEESVSASPESSGERKPEPPAGAEKREAPPAASPAAAPPPSSKPAVSEPAEGVPPPAAPAPPAPGPPGKKLEEDDFPVPQGNIVIIDPEKEKEEKKPGAPGAPEGAQKKAAPSGEQP